MTNKTNKKSTDALDAIASLRAELERARVMVREGEARYSDTYARCEAFRKDCDDRDQRLAQWHMRGDDWREQRRILREELAEVKRELARALDRLAKLA